MTLANVKPGQAVRITHFKPGNKNYIKRLISFGLIPGGEFVVSRLAPLGDPIIIKCLGSFISLRKQEAQLMAIETL